MDEFPLALILASQEEVFHNNNVLYRLVKPLANGSGVQSTDKLVNVVPFRRVYTFHHKLEVLEFEQLLLARPLVLQPVLHFGRGIGSHCGACYNDESWLVMMNQTHPKVLGRFQMGMDLAKQAIEKGQSVEMKFCFTNLIQRIYNEHLQQKENEEAKSFASKFLTMTRFAEWEHADLTIRYHGYEAQAKIKKGSQKKYHTTFQKEWDFDDIGSHEMLWSQIGQEVFPMPHNSPVSEEELRINLPSWTINQVSPLQDIGYDLPKQNYSYAQAGRLYESFRKKKRQRDGHPQNSTDDHLEGAVAGAASSLAETNKHSPGIEHDFSYSEEKQMRPLSRARQAYMDHENLHYSHQQSGSTSSYENYDEYNQNNQPHSVKLNELDDFHASSRNNRMYENEAIPSHREAANTHERYDVEHIHAQVLIQSSNTSSQQRDIQRHNIPNIPPNYSSINPSLTKRDSDRSHCSTTADSGFSDGQRSRGDSYDYNDHRGRSQSKSKHTLTSVDQYTDEGLDNPAFNYEDTQEDALERHKKFVAKMIAEKSGGVKSGHDNNDVHNKFADSQPSLAYSPNQKEEGIAESFI